MINKKRAISLLQEFGDSVIDLYNGTPSVVTIDFSTPYIKTIRRTERFQFKGNVLIFNWTTNKFEAIPVRDIKAISPLSNILKNVRDNNV